MQKSRRQISRRPMSGSPTPAVVEFNPDYTHIKKDLGNIGKLAGIFFALLIILSFILR
jgi:hypothetical protein